MRGCVWRACGALAAVGSLLAAHVQSADAQPLIPLSWSQPSFIDHQPPYASPAPGAGQTPLSAVSCPTALLCVAGDAHGDILASADPAAGPSSWRIARVDNKIIPAPFNNGIVALACPSASLCVGADGSGDLLTSAAPSGGADAWRVTPLESSGPGLFPTSGLTALSCPSVSLCVAADRQGNVLTSSAPSDGASKWRSRNIDAKPGFLGIASVSCSSPTFCVAVDGAGDVITSTNPTGGSSAWKLRNVDGATALFGVSCASTSLCGAGVVVSTNPASGSPSWQHATVDQANVNRLNAVSCPAVSMCVAVDQVGNVVTSTNPSGGASAWTVSSVEYVPLGPGIPGLSGLFAVSCPSASFCLAVDSLGNAARSTDPTGGANAWTVEQIDGSNGPAGLACPSSWCVAVDQAGNVLTSTHPTDPSSWMVQRVDDTGRGSGGSLPGAVSCPSATFCAAVDSDGKVLTSRAPSAGSSWAVTSADPGNLLTSVSCPSSSLCVAVDMSGNAVTSSDPAVDSSKWTVRHIDRDVTTNGTQAALEDVSCPSTSLCVAVDTAGNALTSTDPTAGPAAWTANDVAGTNGLSAVACPARSLCVAGGSSDITVSRAPAAGVRAWATSAIPYALTRISCSTVSFCAAVDQSGDVVISTSPGSGGAAWTGTHIDPYNIEAAACSTSSQCFALDGIGNLSVGRAPTVRELLAPRLRRAVSPPAAARRIGALITRGGYSFRFAAPIAGRLVLTWRLRARHALVARATASFTAARSRQLRLALTRVGKSLLLHASHGSITARAVFKPSRGRSVAAVRSFSIAR
jgi:hypothetical protein